MSSTNYAEHMPLLSATSSSSRLPTIAEASSDASVDASTHLWSMLRRSVCACALRVERKALCIRSTVCCVAQAFVVVAPTQFSGLLILYCVVVFVWVGRSLLLAQSKSEQRERSLRRLCDRTTTIVARHFCCDLLWLAIVARQCVTAWSIVLFLMAFALFMGNFPFFLFHNSLTFIFFLILIELG